MKRLHAEGMGLRKIKSLTGRGFEIISKRAWMGCGEVCIRAGPSGSGETAFPWAVQACADVRRLAFRCV